MGKKKLIGRKAFADLAGVSPGAITLATKPGKALAPAVDGKFIDSAHPAAVAYVEARAPKVITPTKPGPKPKPEPYVRGTAAQRQRKLAAPVDATPAAELPENIQAFADWTLREVVAQYGTAPAFADWLKATKEIESIAAARLKNAAAAGELIPRELVRTHLFGALEAVNMRLLNDSPKTLARQLYAAAKSGQSLEEAEEIIRKAIGAQLRNVKQSAARLLKSAKAEAGADA